MTSFSCLSKNMISLPLGPSLLILLVLTVDHDLRIDPKQLDNALNNSVFNIINKVNSMLEVHQCFSIKAPYKSYALVHASYCSKEPKGNRPNSLTEVIVSDYFDC